MIANFEWTITKNFILTRRNLIRAVIHELNKKICFDRLLIEIQEFKLTAKSDLQI